MRPREADSDGTLAPSEGELACWVPRTGGQLSEACFDEGWNLEIELVWADRPVPGWWVEAICNLSRDKAIDCPRLP